MALQTVDKPSDEDAILALQSRLKGSNFATRLAIKPTRNLSEAIERAYREMEVEDMLDGKFKEARTKFSETCMLNNEAKESTPKVREVSKDPIPKTNQSEIFLKLRGSGKLPPTKPMSEGVSGSKTKWEIMRVSPQLWTFNRKLQKLS